MDLDLTLKHALDCAALWHRAQHRKYPGAEIPYVSHCAGVAVLLAQHGFDIEVVAAGALHDTIEDCGVTYETLADTFGRRVADLVRDVSEEDKTLGWEERKARYLAHFSRKPWDAQAITLADKIDNFRSIAVCRERYGDPWAMFKRGKDAQIARFQALLKDARALTHHPLVDAYERALREIEAIP